MDTSAMPPTPISASTPAPPEPEELTEEASNEELTEGDGTTDAEEHVSSTPAAAVVVPPSAATTPAAPVVPLDDRYDYDHGTILAVIQFRPVTAAEQPRAVWVSVQNGIGNKEDFPLVRFTTATEWEQVLAALLEALKQDLPRRKLLHEARQTQKSASPSSASATRPTSASSSGKKPAVPVPPKSAALPPVPTATSPIPKQDLAMTGLFDDL